MPAKIIWIMKNCHNASVQLYTALESKSIAHNMIDNDMTNGRHEPLTFGSDILFTVRQRLAEDGVMINLKSIRWIKKRSSLCIFCFLSVFVL